MSKANKVNTKKEEIRYPIVEMSEKGRLLISPEMVAQIQFLHASIGKTEWSGILVYDVVSGSPKDPKNFVLEAKRVFLMDIGSAAYTEYSPDEDVIDLYDQMPEAMEMKTGHIHTHHDMTTFFSGTDMGELHDNVDKYNYYLSLIVNFSGNYTAKVVFLSDVTSSKRMSYKDESGTLKNFTIKESSKAMVSIDMEIRWTGLPDKFSERIPELRKKIVEAEKKRNKNGQHALPYGRNDDFYDNEWGNNYSSRSGVKPDPEKLSNLEVERLTRNIISVNAELKEVRPVYTVLYVISDKQSEDDLEFYYDFLATNLEEVIENFFERDLDGEETGMVIDEVVKSIERFSGNFQIKPVANGIISILNEYAASKIDDDDNEDIELELNKIQNEIT